MNQCTALLVSLRPRQWIKNLLVFAPWCFALDLRNMAGLQAAGLGFVAFTMLAGAVYLMNDWRDQERDRANPRTAGRPLATGQLSTGLAMLAAILLCGGGLAVCWALGDHALWVGLLYLGLNVAYSLWLKRMPILDVIAIASGFVLRLEMGGAAADIALSPWILLTTFLLAQFLGFGKRYAELLATRDSPAGYDVGLLDRMIMLTCGATLMSYALYTVDIAEKRALPTLIFTLGFVVYGLFRYMHLLYVRHEGAEPERMLLQDFPLILTLLGWAATTLWMLSLAI